MIGVRAGRDVVQAGSRQGQKSVRGLLPYFWSLNKTTSILISPEPEDIGGKVGKRLVVWGVCVGLA